MAFYLTGLAMGIWAIYEGLAPGIVYFYDDAEFILAFVMFIFVHFISFVLPFAFYMGLLDDWQLPFTEDETYRAPHWVINGTMWYLVVVANAEFYPGFHLLTDGKGNILTDIFVFTYMHVVTLGYTYFNISRFFDDTRTEKFWKRKPKEMTREERQAQSIASIEARLKNYKY